MTRAVPRRRRASPINGAGRRNAAGVLLALLFPRVLDGADVVLAQDSEVRTDSVVPPDAPDARQLPQVFERDYFWTAMRNSAIVTITVVVLALAIAFFAAVALSRFRFRGRMSFIIAVIVIQMIPAEALIISLFQVLDGAS